MILEKQFFFFLMNLHTPWPLDFPVTFIVNNSFNDSEKGFNFFFSNDLDESQPSLARWRNYPFRFLRCTWTFEVFWDTKWGWFWGFAFILRRIDHVWWLVFQGIFWELEVFSHGCLGKREKGESESFRTKKMKWMVYFFIIEVPIYMSEEEKMEGIWLTTLVMVSCNYYINNFSVRITFFVSK